MWAFILVGAALQTIEDTATSDGWNNLIHDATVASGKRRLTVRVTL
jgi:hypothetical protein